MCVRAGDTDSAKKLIDGGVAATTSFRGRTPLHEAAERGLKEIAELLLDKGADVNAKDKWRELTPFAYALREHHKEVAQLLIARGAKATEKERAGLATMPVEKPLLPDRSFTAIALDEAGTLYWVEAVAGELGTFDPATGELKVILRELDVPVGIDVAGRAVYFTEVGTEKKRFKDGRISRLDPVSGEVSVLLAGVEHVKWVCASPGGDVYFMQFSGRGSRHAIWQLCALDAGAGEKTVLAEGAGSYGCLALDRMGRIVVASGGSASADVTGSLLRYSPDGKSRETLIEFPSIPLSMAVDGDGNAYMAMVGADRISFGIFFVASRPPREVVTLRERVLARCVAVADGGKLYYSLAGGGLRL
ncbi:MAG: ankyrin repeat domain-containing protein, partial [Planctomycetota bacterium]